MVWPEAVVAFYQLLDRNGKTARSTLGEDSRFGDAARQALHFLDEVDLLRPLVVPASPDAGLAALVLSSPEFISPARPGWRSRRARAWPTTAQSEEGKGAKFIFQLPLKDSKGS